MIGNSMKLLIFNEKIRFQKLTSKHLKYKKLLQTNLNRRHSNIIIKIQLNFGTVIHYNNYYEIKIRFLL
jgi:hypothetical protein